jgi:transcriptional regulator with XRE-family HTH domain
MKVEDLKPARINRGLSLAEAAKQMGIPPYTLHRVEAGTNVPRPSTAFAIASFYGVTVTDLWPVDGSPVEQPESGAAA